MVFKASEFAGRERATIGSIIGSKLPIDTDQLTTLMSYRGVVEDNINSILMLKRYLESSPEILNEINTMERIFLHEFQSIRTSVYEASKNQTAYPLTSSEWINESTRAINSILKVSESISLEAEKIAKEQSNTSKLNLAMVFGTMVILIFVFYVTVTISRMIIHPLKSLTDAAAKVSEGDLNQTINYSADDEIGKLSGFFDVMIQNIRKAYTDLQSEKENVERKVEAAVRKSEEERKYLEVSTDKMLVEMSKFAGGDLSAYLKVEKNDSIGKLFAGFNKAVDNIAGIIQQVKDAIDATASASNQISSSSEEMAAGAQEQSSQTVEVAAAINQMAKTVIDTSQNASRATAIAKDAGNTAHDGGEVVKETIEGMNQVEFVVKKSANMVHELGKSSEQIGEIIQVIDDIADQTNLLALNAAIEAARAGEQGRGFAVVAHEAAQGIQQIAKASEDLSNLTINLHEMISKFRLKENSDNFYPKKKLISEEELVSI